METPLRRCLSTLDITMLGNISIDKNVLNNSRLIFFKLSQFN